MKNIKNKRVYVLLLAAVICILTIGTTCLAAETNVTPRSYREDLLVSYKEYWYTDGAGVESHVRYGEQYKSFTFLNGYRQSGQTITHLPLNADDLPHGVTIHQQVQIQYEFY